MGNWFDLRTITIRITTTTIIITVKTNKQTITTK